MFKMFRFSLLSLFLLLVGAIGFPTAVFAGTVTWVGANNGNWNTAANWDVNAVPSSTSDVVIASTTAIVVNVPTSTTADFSTLTLTTSTLHLAGSIGTGGSITINNAASLRQANSSTQTITGTLTINSGGYLNHNTNTTQYLYGVLFSVNALTVNSGGSINVDGRGYTATTTASRGGGGGHGGDGATADSVGTTAYCNISNPATIGFGGMGNGTAPGGSGGGLAVLNVTATATLSGTIVARGAAGSSWNSTISGGGGGGGAIKIAADVITGTPQTFSIIGGNGGGPTDGGGGGGGCALIQYTTSNSISPTSSYFSMYGGTGRIYGGAGVTLVKQASQNGTLYVVNNSSWGAESTQSTSTLVVDSVYVSRNAIYTLPSAKTLTIASSSPFINFDAPSGTLRVKSGATTTLSTNATSLVFRSTTLDVKSGGYLVNSSITSATIATGTFMTIGGTWDMPLNTLTVNGGALIVSSTASLQSMAVTSLSISNTSSNLFFDQNLSLTSTFPVSSFFLTGGSMTVGTSTVMNFSIGSLAVNTSTLELKPTSTLSTSITSTSITNGTLIVWNGTTFTSTTMALTVGNGAVSSTLDFRGFTTTTYFAQASTITVRSASFITHGINSSTQSHVINIHVNSLTIDAGAKINVDGKGYNYDGGPGAGIAGSPGSGAGHGGAGGNGASSGGSAYCSSTFPVTIGSGGGDGGSPGGTFITGGLGGGLVMLSISSTLTLNGTITAKGTAGMGWSSSFSGGGGAGGGITIIADTVTGTPQSIDVSGGNSGGATISGSGGGGCFAVSYTTSNSITSSTVTRAGGSTNNAGSAGTFYSGQLNTVPTATSLSITALRDGSGMINFSVIINDADTNNVKLKTEYKSGTCAAYSGQATTTLLSYLTATFTSTTISVANAATDGFQMTNISTLSGANTITYTWNSKVNVPTADGQYCVFVTPNDGTANGTVVSSTITLDNVKPSLPGALSVVSTSTQNFVFQFGTTSTDTNFSEYRLYYRTGASGVTQTSTAFTSSTDSHLASSTFAGFTTTTIASLSTSTQYAFNIWAFDSFGNSATATAEIAGYTLADTPSSISQSSRNTNQLALSWQSTNPTNTEFYVSNSTNGNVSGWITTSTWTDTGLSCAQSYLYSVKARNGDSVETGSTSASIATTGCPGYSAPLSFSPGYSAELVTTTPTTTPVVTPPIEVILPPAIPPLPPLPPPSIGTGGVNLRFTKNLALSVTYLEVQFLQQLLNKLSFMVAIRGVGSPGRETQYFGTGTRNALRTFQRANHIPVTGKVDVTTRALLNTFWLREFPTAESKQTIEVPLSQPAVLGEKIPIFFTKNLSPNMVDSQVLLLQQTLNRLGYTVAKTGPGSAGHETARFGAATYRAVLTFQKKNGLKTTGSVDAATRAKLNQL